MPTYSDPFGGGVVDPAENSWRALALTMAETLLAWPGYEAVGFESSAAKMDITSSIPGAQLRLPDARAASVGIGILFRNLSANAVTLEDSTGSTVAVLTTGAARLVYLIDNATAAGSWASIVYGVGTGTLDVGAAAGYGLQATGAQLEADWPASEVVVNFAVNAALRASMMIWIGGAGTATFGLASSLGSGYIVGFRNAGTGILTIATTGGDTIDGASSIALQPQESCLVFTTGAAKFYSIGRGRNQQFNFTLLIKDISASGTITLTPTEASNVVQRYTGALVSNTEIVLPSVVQVYYVSNQTSGAFTVTLKTSGVGSTVSVPSGQNAVVFCDGLNVINNSTTVSGLSSVILNVGSITAPSLSFSGDTSTGLYRPVAGSVGVVGIGTEVLRLTGVASGVNYLQVSSAAAGGSPAIAAAGTDANINIVLTPKGTGAVTFGTIAMNNGTAALPALRFASDTTTGLFRAAASSVGVAGGGLEVARFAGVASAVNSLQVNNAITTAAPGLTAIGTDANINIVLTPKGTGAVVTSGPVSAPLGAVATPSYSFTGDLNTGMYSPAADTWAVSTAGIERMRVLNTVAGRTDVTVGKTTTLLGAAGRGTFEIEGGGSTAFSMSIAGTSAGYLFHSGSDLFLTQARNGSLNLGTNLIDRLVIASGGNVTVNAPVSGDSLTLNTLANRGLQILSATNPAIGFQEGVGSIFWMNSNSVGMHFGGNGATAPSVGALTATSDGRLYGSALHNNAGSVAGTTNQYIASGTYTPALALITNIAAASSAVCQWIRVGNVVTVSGVISINCTAAGGAASRFALTVPIASNLTALSQLGGSGVQGNGSVNGLPALHIVADTVNDRADVFFQSGATGAFNTSFTFTYLVA
jgi:hypothetical protein